MFVCADPTCTISLSLYFSGTHQAERLAVVISRPIMFYKHFIDDNIRVLVYIWIYMSCIYICTLAAYVKIEHQLRKNTKFNKHLHWKRIWCILFNVWKLTANSLAILLQLWFLCNTFELINIHEIHWCSNYIHSQIWKRPNNYPLKHPLFLERIMKLWLKWKMSMGIFHWNLSTCMKM